MKIFLESAVAVTTPPVHYGGLEAIVASLAIELTKRGHEVTVAGAKGSRPLLQDNINVIETVEPEWTREAEGKAFHMYKDRLKEFDIIHSHSHLHWAYIAKRDDPSLKVMSTTHDLLPFRTPPPVEHANMCCVSDFHSNFLSKVLGIPIKTAYNGVPIEHYLFKAEKGERFLFLNRITHGKGALEAVKLAKKLNIPIDICGEDMTIDDPGYVREVMDQCDGSLIHYYGRIPEALKIELLQNARALITPLVDPYREVFGLYMVEAGLCGTPNIITDKGATREIVVDGVSGFVCEDVSAVEEAIKRVDEISPEDCRREAERFSVERMVNTYIKFYSDVLDNSEW